jgi:phosphatidate cytidylyltransferase
VFRTRLLTAVIVVPLVVAMIWAGGLWFFALATVVLTLAVVEFCRLMERERFRPAPAFAIALLWAVLLDAQFPEWRLLRPGVSLVLMASLTWQLVHRESSPMADWALGVAGALYVGWCGAHLILLRGLPEGLWWIMTVLPSIWLADSGAYLIGRSCGRHRLAPTLSPGKTWEGYTGGIVVGTFTTAGLTVLWSPQAGPAGPTPVEGLALGFLIGTLAPLGDLVVSMIKREAKAKDTSSLFPGHGGALDRVDSLLWAAVIGYYFILWLRGL